MFRINVNCISNTDWGSESYGTPVCKFWVLEEDDQYKTAEWFNAFAQNPEDPQFAVESSAWEPKMGTTTPVPEVKEASQKRFAITTPSVSKLRQPFGPVTLYILLICSWIFMWGKITAPTIESYPSILPATAVLSPPINKSLFYDYPQAYVMIDKLIKFYGLEKLRTPDELPPEGQYLYLKYFRTPYWEGI